MKRIIVAVLLIATPLQAAAANSIYFQITSDNVTHTFMNIGPFVNPALRDVAMLTFDKPFSRDMIQRDYYQISVTHGIAWNKDRVVQYDYIPIAVDRFRHVIWLTPDNKGIIKLTIYDEANEVMFNAVCMDEPLLLRLPSPELVNVVNTAKFIYKGFVNARTEINADGSMRMLFTDGLNQFSVFRHIINPKDDPPPERLKLYGNYVYSRQIGKFTYTVVGTLPFDIMEDIIVFVDSKVIGDEIVSTGDRGPISKERLRDGTPENTEMPINNDIDPAENKPESPVAAH